MAVFLLLGAVAVIELEGLSGNRVARGRPTTAMRAREPQPRPVPRADPANPESVESHPADAPAARPAPELPPAVLPKEPVPPEPASLVLTRIVHDGGDPEATFAVISGRAVRAGDSIAGLQVVGVEPDRVRLEGESELTLKPGKEGD